MSITTARRAASPASLIALFFSLTIPALAIAQASDLWLERAQSMAATVTITRDEFGVPHIAAPTDEAAVFGFVYARAEDEFAYVERSIIASLGRLSETMGEEAVSWDRFVRSLEVPQTARREYDESSPKLRAICDAGADALNYYLHNNPDVEPALHAQFEPWWFHAQELAFNVYMGIQAAQSVGEIDTEDIPGIASPVDGSNAWAIAPSRTTGGADNGHAMLFINPHIPLPALYEGHLTSDEGWNFYGGTAYGRGLMPLLGHNARLGWSLTVNYPDIADVYRVTFDNLEDPLAYRYDGAWRRATQWTDTIGVKLDDGTIDERVVRFVKTHHGPVVGTGAGSHIAVRISKIYEGGLLGQWYAMSKAQNLEQFKAAIAPRALCFHNIIYADADGNIFYLYNGAIPRRSDRFDWTKPVDGSDPATEWDGYYEIAELPQVLNPPCGYIQSCNSDPFLTSADGNPVRADFPKPMIGTDSRNYRVKMSHAILGRDEPFDFEGWSAAAFDTYVHAADDFVPRIQKAWSGLLKSDPERAEKLREPVTALVAWDRRSTVESRETTLFMLWLETSLGEIWSGAWTDEKCLSNLEKIIEALETSFERWDVAWGEVNRHQRPGPDAANPFSDSRESLPTAGAHGSAGIVFTFLARSQNTKLRYGFHGHSYASAVEFSDPPRAGSIVPYGQSRDPESPHFADQMALYASGKFKPVHFTPAQVRAHAERVYHPGE